MSTYYTETLNIADEINRTLSSGQNINTEQLDRLMSAYNRDGIKNEKVDSMWELPTSASCFISLRL